MAIIVDEGEKKGNVLGIFGWVVFLGIVAAAVYYVFFAQPQLVPVTASGSLSAIAPIAQLSLHPESVVQGSAFQALVASVTLPTPQGPVAVGRSNPFISP